MNKDKTKPPIIMKILYIDTPLDPPGGGQNSLLLILQHLNKSEFDPLVFIPYKCEFADLLKKINIPCQIIPQKSLFSKIKKLNPSIIHCNSATTRYTFYSMLASRLLRIPSIWHVRMAKSAGLRDKIISLLTERIVVISDAVGEKFKWIKQKVARIYNAVDTEIFRPGLEVDHLFDEFRIEKTTKIVGIFSRIEPWKGHILFFDSMKIIKDKIRNVKFLVVGEGKREYRSRLEGYVKKLGLKKDVIFTGFRKDIPQLINLCHVIISSSIEPEPFGRTIIEAMACGRPVVSTNLGGPREIIDNGKDGFLVSPDLPEIADAAIKLLKDENLRRTISKNAIYKVKAKFSIHQQIRQIENLYRKLLEKKR